VYCQVNCGSYTSCAPCTEAGCSFFCQHYSLGPNCSAATTAAEADCTGTGETPDKFITTSPQCYGGCNSAEDCPTCSNFVGCGWCFLGASVACIPVAGSNATCNPQALAVGTCVTPCAAQSDCQLCTQANCQWCETGTTYIQGYCEDIGTANSCPAANLWTSVATCPPIPKGNSASQLAIFLPLIALLIAALL